MAKVITTELQHSGASGANITLDSSKNVTVENNLTVDGTTTLTGAVTLPAGTTQDTLSFRNLIINGAMNVAQRETSATGNGYKSVDRFQVQFGGDTGVAQAQVALTSSDTGPWEKGFRNCFKVTNASTADETSTSAEARITYNIEAQDIASSGWEYNNTSSNLTVSCWFKSNVAETFYMVLRSRDGTNQGYCTPITLAANTWTKFTKTVPGAANIQINSDNGEGLAIHIYLFLGSNSTTSSHTNNAWAAYNGSDTTPDFETSGSWFAGDASSTFQITGLQLEAGDTATDFEHRSYGDELVRCQRYYQRLGHQMLWAGRGNGSASFVFGVPLPVALRAASPTVTMSGTLKTFEHDASSESTNVPTAGYGYGENAAAIALVQDGHSGLTDDRCINGYIHGTGSYLALSSEL